MFVNVYDSAGNVQQIDLGLLVLSNLSNLQGVSSQPPDFAVMLAVPCANGGRRPVLADSNMFVWNPAGTTAQYIDGTGSVQTFPTIPAAQIQSNWTQASAGALDFIKNKPSIPSVLKTTSLLTLAITGSGATGTQISSTKDAEIGVTYKTSTTSTLAGANTSVVQVKVCATNSATESDWVEYGRTENDQPSGISVVIGQVISAIGQIVVPLPAAWFVKAIASGTGTHVEAAIGGWQTIFG